MSDLIVQRSPLESALRSLISTLPPGVQNRVDGWASALTGLGTINDKATYTSPTQFYGLADEALSALFHGDSLARKIVSKAVRTAFSKGVGINVPDAAGGVAASTRVHDELDRLCVTERFTEAMTWENLFGGAAIWIGVDDGQRGEDSQTRPIRLESLQRVLWLKVIDRRYVHRSARPGDVDTDPSSPAFGQPSHFAVSAPVFGGSLVSARVHRSRLIVFPGAAVTAEQRESRGGWGISALDPVYDVLQRNANAWSAAGNAIGNAQYTVYALKGLSAMLAMADSEAKMKSRSRAMEMAKSMINAILIDADDRYTREKIDFGNLPEMLDRMMIETSAAADMPVTELWGRSAAGMNASGEGDREMWHASVKALQTQRLQPRIEELIKLLMHSKQGPTRGRELSGWSVTFPELEVLGAGEQARRYLSTAQADVAYIDSSVLTAGEVAASRFRAGGYSTDTTIDLEARKEMQEAEIAELAAGLDALRGIDERSDARTSPNGVAGVWSDDKAGQWGRG